MAKKKTPKTNSGTFGDMTGTTEEVARAVTEGLKPLEQARHDLADRIKPGLKLSELAKTSEMMKVVSAQQAAIEQALELTKSSELMKAISTQQKMAERARASLQLPRLEEIAKQATEAPAIASKSFAGLPRAHAIAKDAASTTPAPVEPALALPSPPAGRMDNAASFIPIRSAHEIGRLIRETRERRKLSQQAFADLVGVGRRFISELENGKATLEFDKVLQVALASGIDVLARRRR